MSSSGLLAYHVANDVVVSAANWYTFLCANDVRSQMGSEPLAHQSQWLISVTIDHASCNSGFYLSVVLGDCWLLKLFFYGMNLDKATR